MSLKEKQAEVRQQLQRVRIAPRKLFNRDKVDYNTLYAMYVTQGLQINEIARRINRTRGRVWQILKEYGLHDPNRKQIALVCVFCHKPFKAVKSRVNNGGGKYCCEDHYHEHRRLVSAYKPNKHGQRLSRKKIVEYLGIPSGFDLPALCVVHHEDGNCLNTDIDNLFVFPSHSDHLKYHHAKRHGKVVLPYREISELPDKLKAWFPV